MQKFCMRTCTERIRGLVCSSVHTSEGTFLCVKKRFFSKYYRRVQSTKIFFFFNLKHFLGASHSPQTQSSKKNPFDVFRHGVVQTAGQLCQLSVQTKSLTNLVPSRYTGRATVPPHIYNTFKIL